MENIGLNNRSTVAEVKSSCLCSWPYSLKSLALVTATKPLHHPHSGPVLAVNSLWGLSLPGQSPTSLLCTTHRSTGRWHLG